MYLNDANIIHTDIKPENILFNVKDSKIEKVVISDFNVLKKINHLIKKKCNIIL